jgi:hypothetical protein
MVAALKAHGICKLEENGTYRYTFVTPSREAVVELFEFLTAIHNTAPQRSTVRCIVDVSISGMPSLTKLYHMWEQWFEENPQHRTSRTLFITQPDPNLVAATSLMQLLSGTHPRWDWKFVTQDEYRHGIDWLMSNR